MDRVRLIVQCVRGVSGWGLRHWVWRALVMVIIAAVGRAAVAADLGVAKGFFPTEPTTNVESAEGAPPSAPVRAAGGRLLGYAFSTRDVSGSVGYSGGRSISWRR